MTTVTKQGLVEFSFFRRDASDVRVVGDFGTAAAGESATGEFALTGSPDGWWRATVALDAGDYRFRYVADGVWFTDYASNGIEVSKTGVNSLLVVPERKDHAPLTPAVRMVA
jgi:1,4-alpha-glucan branching enzyme